MEILNSRLTTHDSKPFPKGFLWGSATSAYQVEGGNRNSDWESNDLFRMNLPVAGQAVDHYNRFEEDFDIARSLNQNAHRLSIEWARIEPENGKFDEREVSHYREVLQSLHRRGIKPLVTLHHFTNPLWVAKGEGWENSSTVGYFESYVRYVVTNLRDLCDFWVTINEPAVYISQGYILVRWPPQKLSPKAAFLAGRNLLKAHQSAYRIIHEIQPKALVGFALSLSYLRTPIGGRIAPWEKFFVDQAGLQDFLGVNYYRAVGWTKNLPKSDLGWAIYPAGLEEILGNLKRYGLPIYITENGIADRDDDQRADFIADHLAAAWQAIRAGANVRGYFHWSLLDNFEWEKGFGPRFGLVEVDYKTLKRTIRPSAQVYAKIAKNNSL